MKVPPKPPHPVDTFPTSPTSPTSPSSEVAQIAQVRFADSVQPRRPSWLWEGRIPLAELTLCVGRGGLGKTLAVGADLAARVSRGDLEGDLDGPATVLISSAEDSADFTLVPRLMAAGADLSRVGFIQASLQLPDQADVLEDTVREYGAKLVVLDPLNAHIGGSLDSHNDHQLRTALRPLADLTHETGCTVVAISHVNKSRSGDAYTLVSGSIAYYNGPRSVLVVAADPEADEEAAQRVLVHAKSNLSGLAPPRRFSVQETSVETVDGPASVARVVWGEDAPDLSAEDVLAGVDAEERTAVADATAWLRQQLGAGPRPASALKRDGEREGHRPRTLERARKRLGATYRRDGFQGPFVWSLPDPDSPTSPTGEVGEVGEVVALDVERNRR